MSEQDAFEDPVWMQWHDEQMPVRLGVSACLLGGEVRFDGGHKRDRYLTDILGLNVEWLPVCPEIEAGMGVPRPVLQLRGGDLGEHLVLRESGEDWTERMGAYADSRIAELEGTGLDGFVLKKDSPSCGMSRVRVYGRPGGMPSRDGVGHFVQALIRNLPDLPTEEEGRLRDPGLRERFIEEVFSHNRWRVMVAKGLSRRRLVAFHEAHKMLLLAHDVTIYREIGQIVASFGRKPDEAVYREYHRLFVRAFRQPTTIARHVNVLEHLFGHIKKKITSTEKREIARAIEDYRSGRTPLIVVISLLRFLVAAHDVEYVKGQLYLEPHPGELKLRNHV